MIDITDKINVNKIRSLIRDEASLNPILAYEEQFEDEEIFDKADDVNDFLNSFYPALDTNDIPKMAINYLIISFLLKSVANQELRNQMQINDDNVNTIDYSNKAPQYLQLSDMYMQQAKEILNSIARKKYFSEMWGSSSSIASDFEGL